MYPPLRKQELLLEGSAQTMGVTIIKLRESFMIGRGLFRFTLLSGAAVVGFLPSAAWAQVEGGRDAELASGEATQIIVTAQRREENLQDVPITITSISQEKLKDANIIELQDIVKVSPGTRFDSRYSYFTPGIRGISTTQYLPGNPSNVAVYLDGFTSPALASSNFQLMNIENVQVLKGPQGTLFGRNTTGGAILVNTAKPSFDSKVTLEAGYGSYNAHRIEGYATTGLSENLAVDAAVRYAGGDGWITNVFTGDDEAGKFKNFNLRLGLYFEPSDDFSLLMRYERGHRNDPTGSLMNVYLLDGQPSCVFCATPGAITTTKRGEVALDELLDFFHDTEVFQLTAELDVGSATITSYTQYKTDDAEQLYSLDLTNIGAVALQGIEENEIFTQEILVNSNPGPRFQWTLGAYYFYWDSQWPYVGRAPGAGSPAPYPQFLESGIVSESLAGFADATYQVTDNLFLTGGLRYTHDALKNAYSNFFAVGPAYPPTLTTDRITPRAVVRYEFDSGSSLYASVSRGYKAAIYNISSTTTPGVPIAPEDIWAYEIGYKHAGQDLSFNVSSYYYDYSDQQLQKSVIINNTPQAVITNAASAEIYGIEADVSLRLGNHFSLNAGANWNHARYKEFQDALDLSNNLIDASGLRLSRAPDFTATVGAGYTTDLGGGELKLSGNLFYTSRFYFDLTQDVPQDSYATLDLRAEWTDPSETYTIALSGKNVTDTHYYNQAAPNALGIGAIWGAPAQVEASIRVMF